MAATPGVLTLVVGALVVLASVTGASGAPLVVIDIGYRTPTPVQQRISAQTCAGLYNRAADTPVYVLQQSRDVELLHDVAGVASVPATTPTDTFMHACLHGSSSVPPVAKGAIVYNYTAQQALVPIIITLAGVLDAVPLEASDPAAAGVPVVLDAARLFAGMSALNATAYVYDRYANQTATMAIMDPGYNQADGGPLNPKLTGEPSTHLIDYIVKRRLFNFYLVEACVPFTDDHALMNRMTAQDGQDPWPRPIPTYGYNDADNILGGDFFEAETNCVSQHDMGQIASDSADNMAFFSRSATITQPLVQNPTPAAAPYNSSLSYVTLVVGDGDNIGMVAGARFDWMQGRVAKCGGKTGSSRCYPLVWTLSPQALHMAPNLTRWFYEQAASTGADYFMLPPSGDLYSYPSMMGSADQATYVGNTERVAHVMNTSATVDWEWFLTWSNAFKTYFPRYAAAGVVRGVFGVCVPFDFPVLPFWGEHDSYKIVPGNTAAGGKVVVFQPREWRGSGNTTIPFSKKEYYTPAQMAAELNGNARGTVSYIYLTSDGGASLTQFDDLVPLLADHVRVVDHNTIVSMALQRG